jgi:hypothetical protein
MNVAAVIRAGRRPSMAPPYTLGIPRPAEAVGMLPGRHHLRFFKHQTALLGMLPLDDHRTRVLQSMACPLFPFSFIDYLYFCGMYLSHFRQSSEAIDDPHQA